MKKMTKAMVMALIGYLVIEEPQFCESLLKIAMDSIKKVEKKIDDKKVSTNP